MAEIDGKPSETLAAFDPLIQTEDIAFDPKELIVCGGCGRMNPPNRHKCVYCGLELEIELENATAIKPNLRKLELWERGWNVIVREMGSQVDNAKIAQVLSMEAADLAATLGAGTPLPLARVESENEAAILQQSLGQLGLECLLVSDTSLAADKPPVRLGKIDLIDGRLSLKDFNTGKLTAIEAGDLVLIIPGFITASKVDSLERRGRRGKAKLIDGTVTTSDESILDIYSRGDSCGFRVYPAGFDFSCLGERKGFLAGENLQRLVARLKEHAPNAKLVNDYAALRHVLGHVWRSNRETTRRG